MIRRIEWDPLDASTASLVDGVVTVDGRVLCRDVHDMRWLGDGQIMTFDRENLVRWWKDGAGVARQVYRDGAPSGGIVAANGGRFVAIYDSSFRVHTVTGHEVFHQTFHEVDYASGVSVAMSGDGRRLALGYITRGEVRGRGFMVYDVERGTLIDRSFTPHAVDLNDTLALELDYAGKRLIQGIPEPAKGPGVIRLDTGEIYPRQMPGDVSAVAIDRTGELAAYAYREPPDGGRGRLRFDYLDRAAKGAVIVGVLDTQWLDCELPVISAMAFSRDRRRLACLSLTGAIEIVPVP